MDIIDQIEIPSFERRRNANFRRNFAVAAGIMGMCYVLERYTGSVSRSWKSVHRGVTAAIAAWLEDHGGMQLFSLEGEEPPPLYQSVLDINGMCGPRLSHDGGASAAAASLLAARHQREQHELEAATGGGAEHNHDDPMASAAAAAAATAHLFASADTPNFFQSTKFFACLDVEEAQELFRATRKVSLAPHEVLFRSGDPSDSGIFIVLHGSLGVFLEEPGHNSPPIHANTLRSGESVGDLDVVDGEARTVSCMALEAGCLLVNVPRDLFMDFVHTHPRALMLYLQQGLARLWRVAHFVLADFLQLQLHRPPRRHPMARTTSDGGQEAADGLGGGGLPPSPPAMRTKPLRTLSNLFGHEQATQTDDLPRLPLPPPPPPPAMQTPPTSQPQEEEERNQAQDTELALGKQPSSVAAGGGDEAVAAAAGPGAVRTESSSSSSGGSSKSRRRKAEATAAEAAANASAAPASTAAQAAPPAQQSAISPFASAATLSDVSAPAPTVAGAGGANGAKASSAPVAPAADSAASPLPYPASPTMSLARAASSSGQSAPTFNELLASAAASARSRGAGGQTHGPLRQEAAPPGSAKAGTAAATAAAALLANVPASAAADGGSPAVATATAATPPKLVPDGEGEGNVGTTASRPQLPASPSPTSSASGNGGRASGQGASAAGMPPNPRDGGGGGLRAATGTLPPRPAVSPAMSVRPQGPVCRLLPGRSQSVRRSFVLGQRACLAAGWDVIDVEELAAAFDDNMWATMSDPRAGVGLQLPLSAGGLLQDLDWASGCFYLLLDGHLLAERPAGGGAGSEDSCGLGLGGGHGGGAGVMQESAIIAPGSLVSCAAFLSSTVARCKVVALEPSRLVAFSWQTLEVLVSDSPDLLIRLLLAAASALGPVIRRFISLGLNRVWLESGDVAYRQGDYAECLYVVISGRLRLLHETEHPVTHARQLHLEEEVGRGEAVGAVWAITGGHHDTTALCVRDSELVRMSRSAFRVISADSPLALSKLFSNIARRLVAAWDSRVRSDRGPSSSGGGGGSANNAALAAVAAGGGGGGAPVLGQRLHGGGAAGGGLQQLPIPLRPGLTPPMKSAGQLAAGGGAGRGPRAGGGKRGEIVTIAILPAGQLPESAAAAAMAAALSGSPTDVAAAASALAAAEAASMGGGGVGQSGTGPAGVAAGGYGPASGGSRSGVGMPQWRSPPGIAKQASALATLTAIKRLSGALKESLSSFGPVLLLDATVLSLQFPAACERLDVLFYRSKVTSWMAAQEEEYRFIVLEADVAASPWSSVCVAQADCILLVAPEGSTPQLSQPESLLVFNAASPAFARPKAVRSGLTPGYATTPASGASRSITPAASSSHLVAVGGAMPPGAGSGAGAGRVPLRFNSSNSSSGRERGKGGDERSDHAPGDTATNLAATSEAAPAATTSVPGSVGGSMHPHHQYGMAYQQLYGNPNSAAMLRRVELVLLHNGGDGGAVGSSGGGRYPSGTAEWLAGRPNLSRHHHVRLGRPADIQRLARWMAGKAVGIVLAGGGSRGLAHLGVLTALEDAGVPLDAVGGTSQGAFMAALYAQGLGREALDHSVRAYAAQLGSVRHLLSDLTLPVLSLFSGNAFDTAVQRVFERGAQRLEDLWLPFFCVTTNLTRGEASVHTAGLLWKLVRASMTIVGLLPPVWEDGCLLVDGGYMNPVPVDVMRGLMGVDSVLVVDVEGRDDMGWRNLTPYDGGLSGWRLLWDRWCPFPRLRFSSSPSATRPLRYASLINKLTCMTHAANLKRVAVEHRIDLYLHPPGIGGYKLMDFHLMDRIVKDAYRYATSAVTQWKSNHRVGAFGIEGVAQPAQPMASPGPSPANMHMAPQTGGASMSGTGGVAGRSPAPQPLAAPAAQAAPLGGAPPASASQLHSKQPAATAVAAVTGGTGGGPLPSTRAAQPNSSSIGCGSGSGQRVTFGTAMSSSPVAYPAPPASAPMPTPVQAQAPPQTDAAAAAALAGGGRGGGGRRSGAPPSAALRTRFSLDSAGGRGAHGGDVGADSGGVGGADSARSGSADGGPQPLPVAVGSPPSPGPRPLGNKMSRSATRHSLHEAPALMHDSP